MSNTNKQCQTDKADILIEQKRKHNHDLESIERKHANNCESIERTHGHDLQILRQRKHEHDLEILRKRKHDHDLEIRQRTHDHDLEILHSQIKQCRDRLCKLESEEDEWLAIRVHKTHPQLTSISMQITAEGHTLDRLATSIRYYCIPFMSFDYSNCWENGQRYGGRARLYCNLCPSSHKK